MKVLVVQNNAITRNKRTTFDNVYFILEKYMDKKTDLIVFPEVWSVGWNCEYFADAAEKLSESETLDFIKNIAIEFNSAVIGGSFIQKCDSCYKNTCPIVSNKGRLITTYDKIHLFSHKGAEEDKYIQAGNKLKILDFGYTKVGVTVCYDIRFPEIYRRYSNLGVEVFVNVAAWSSKKPEHWDIMHKARAIENQCFALVANQTGKIKANEYNLGHSMLINPWGKIIAKLESEEDCLYTEINIEEVRKLRKEFPLLKDRKDGNFTSFDFEEIKIYE